MQRDELLQVDLSDDERDLLRRGLIEWGGPAQCTEEFARAMGFRDVQDLFNEGDRLKDAIAAGQPLTRYDWCRVLLATEVVFVSSVVGSGWDWRITTGVDDHSTLETLRGLQRRLTREVRPLLGHGVGTRPSRRWRPGTT